MNTTSVAFTILSECDCDYVVLGIVTITITKRQKNESAMACWAAQRIMILLMAAITDGCLRLVGFV